MNQRQNLIFVPYCSLACRIAYLNCHGDSCRKNGRVLHFRARHNLHDVQSALDLHPFTLVSDLCVYLPCKTSENYLPSSACARIGIPLVFHVENDDRCGRECHQCAAWKAKFEYIPVNIATLLTLNVGGDAVSEVLKDYRSRGYSCGRGQ